MARFKYRMQSILDLKIQLEEAARQRFSLAQMKLNQEEEVLESLRARKRFYEEEGVRLRQDALKVQEIIDNKAAILRMDDYIAEQQEVVRLAEDALERERKALTEVMTERKSHEKLRERALEEFMKEEAASESKAIDELTSYRYTINQEG